MPGRIERLHSYEDVVTAAGGDPHARWGIDPSTDLDGAARDGAVVWTVRREHHARTAWSTALGEPAGVAALVTDLLAGATAPLNPAPAGITVPFGTLELLADAVRPPEFGDWTWWWTDQPPPVQAAEHRVVELPVAHPAIHDELVAMLREANPEASAEPDDPLVRTWCGIRDGDRLVASAADRPYVPGVAHLASIATHPDVRGRGYGSAVTAWLTRRRLVDDEAAVVTLGMFSMNDAARSVYLRLGLRPEHRFTSGSLPTAYSSGGAT